METAEAKSYEISFLLKDEVAAHDLVKILKQEGADIRFEGPLKKVSLAYPMKKEQQGHFGYFHFELSPEKIGIIDREFKMNQKILRFLIVTPPFMKSTPAPSSRPVRSEFEEKRTLPNKSLLPLSNEELEKKIDEILQ